MYSTLVTALTLYIYKDMLCNEICNIPHGGSCQYGTDFTIL